MIPCDNITLQSELKAYLDGQLPFLLRLRVRRHLGNCAACREELSAMEQISNKLRADGPKPLQASLRDRILNAVSNTGAVSEPDTPLSPARRRRKPLLIWAGAATAFVAWFTLYPLLHGDALRTGFMQHSESNLKQLGTGSMLYTQDYDEVKPSSPQRGTRAGMPMNGPVNSPVATAEPPLSNLVSAAGASKFKSPAHLRQLVGNLDTGRSVDENGRDSAGLPQPQKRYDAFEDQQRKGRAQMVARMLPSTKTVDKPGETTASLAQAQEEEKVERQVHREATLTVQVDNPEAKSETAAQFAQTAGGYVASNELTTGDDNTKTASLTLKVPVAQFEAVLGQVAHMGEVKAKNVTGEDLTEKISDQQQAEHILRQDIGTTQEELTHRLSKPTREERMDTLRELRTRIAQTKARLQLLRRLGTLSTITLELTEKPRPTPPPKVGGFMSDMNDTLHGAMQSMMQAARLPILTFIWILAYSPLWILLLVGYRYAVRR